MTVDLPELIAPGHTAIVTQECQGAVMGPNAGLAVLANEARREALPNIVRLLPAGRAAGVHVVHCLVQRRRDGLGSNHNAKIFAIGRTEVDITPGSEGATLLPELGPEPTDVVLHRWHGVGPMGGQIWTRSCATWGCRRSWRWASRSTWRSPTWSWTR
jgi:nicotinamidase-related amidase